MNEHEPLSPGRVLRVWREYTGLSAAELARGMHMQRTAISNWERNLRGRKAASLDNVKRMAAVLQERQLLRTEHAAALEGMWRTVSTTEVLPGRPAWFHNFPEPPGPVWVWLRSKTEEKQCAVLQIGPFDREFAVPPGHGGLVICSPTSVPNPPLKVMFQSHGWADFGAGEIPLEVTAKLGITVVDAVSVIGQHAPRTPPLEAADADELKPGMTAMRRLAREFKLRWSLLEPHFGDLRPSHRSPQALDGESVVTLSRATPAGTDDRGALTSQLLMTGEQIRAVRDARGLSRSAAAREATHYDPAHPIPEKALEKLETTGRVPPTPHFLARLDTVYQTDGRLGIERTFDSVAHPRSADKPYILSFPNYWQGHIWLQPRGGAPNETCDLELRWGPWQRRVRLSSQSVVTTRKATTDAPPLVAYLPPGWHLTAGIGAVPTALDINVGWRPVSFAAARQLIRDNINSILRRPSAHTHKP
ncbi:helix-turn-helix transcriptional regulator [Streptomyces mirabilis]|uniref:helix-turn-helix transcriptional regulator n=1 Tax=Streptomyces mirabilis TaxID=68239 RepID=UPI0036939FF8